MPESAQPPRKSSKTRQGTPRTLALHKYVGGDTIKVSFNRRSLAICALFVLNLVLTPLVAYIFEPFSWASSDSYFGSLPHSPSPRWSATVVVDMQALTPFTATNASFYAMSVPIDDHACSFALLPRVPGVIYLPKDFGPRLLFDLCTNVTLNHIARAWTVTALSRPVSVSVAWSTQSEVVYLHVLPGASEMWVLLKLIWRLVLCMYIGKVLHTRFFRHVYHLYENLDLYPLSERSKGIKRYEILVGDPTAIVVSDPILCAGFCFDVLASADHTLQAVTRVLHPSSTGNFVLSSIYLSRHVWFSYAALLVLHSVLKRYRVLHWCVAQSTTILAIVVTVLLSAVANIALRWYPLVGVVNSLFCIFTTPVGGDYFNVEASPALLLTYAMLWTVPVLLGRRAPEPRPDAPELPMMFRSVTSIMSAGHQQRSIPLDILSLAQAARQPSATPIPALNPNDDHILAKFAFNDWKQIMWLWLCCPRQRNDADFCTGGSIYRLFEMDPSHQTLATINHRGTDCYVYSYIAADQLADVARVSLLGRLAIKGARQQRKIAVQARGMRDSVHGNVQRFAVGRVVLRKPTEKDENGSAGLIFGARNSPWVE
ncbi:hypothetical protein ACHHYP_04369 [Achlya hypogyna]|uniref:Transmembrane protein n=1 Tax=Achlya hypogyna TaxID=1202772 RepID=A0A1V9Z197_ACHHY|nr:hypothetical protein ACHHYP_04369 [Achlya hypogyna]